VLSCFAFGGTSKIKMSSFGTFLFGLVFPYKSTYMYALRRKSQTEPLKPASRSKPTINTYVLQFSSVGPTAGGCRHGPEVTTATHCC
jgi:hypothetical protein